MCVCECVRGVYDCAYVCACVVKTYFFHYRLLGRLLAAILLRLLHTKVKSVLMLIFDLLRAQCENPDSTTARRPVDKYYMQHDVQSIVNPGNYY